MAHTPSVWPQLNAIFEQDIPLTTQLLDLLQTERKALEERDYDTFQQVTHGKQNLLKTLEDHAMARQQLLQSAGFDSEQGTLDAADSEAPAVGKAWRTLRQQWQQCQELNEINALIAKRTHLVVDRILDLLRGTSGNTKLYDSKGGTRSGGGGHTITSA